METIRGYEIHMGKSRRLDQKCKPLFNILSDTSESQERLEGAVDDNRMVFGTYLHGIFDAPPLRRGLIDFILKKRRITKESNNSDIKDVWEKNLTILVDVVKKNLDLNLVFNILDLT